MQVTKHCLMVIAAACSDYRRSGRRAANAVARKPTASGCRDCLRLTQSIAAPLPLTQWEVRVSAVVFYADESGRYVVRRNRDLGTRTI